MDKNHDTRQQLLVELMTGGGASFGATDPLLHPWLRLARRLSPLIGESGFCALYARASRLLLRQYDWLDDSSSSKSIEGLLKALGGSYGAVNADVARAANGALLNTFTKLLSDLIGEALTIRLLHSAAHGEGELRMDRRESNDR